MKNLFTNLVNNVFTMLSQPRKVQELKPISKLQKETVFKYEPLDFRKPLFNLNLTRVR